MMLIVLAWLGGYLCGSIPFGLLLGLLKGVDIRTQGSGNIGATNAGRVLGKPYGLAVFALDGLKGLMPTVLFGILLRAEGRLDAAAFLLWVAMVAACVMGHMFPVFLKFKGGKGVATSLGAVLGLYPYLTWAGLLAFGLWIVLTWASRYVSVGSIGAVIGFPVIFALLASSHDEWGTFQELWPLHAFSVALALLVIYRHRSNIRRLLAGTESRIGATAQNAGPPSPNKTDHA
ncbi:MAG: glycerol-3-phosphate 1-O-acyltransferase PlsY [Phycisphaerales bacterium]|nr:glycerol-3-phosphate 1-O-acyltransferase PlsY [Phycisphaerales bacterium]